MHIKVTGIITTTDDELVLAMAPTKFDTEDFDNPMVTWLFEFITRNKLAAAKHKLRVCDVTATMKRSKGLIFLDDTKINRRTKPREAYNRAIKWFADHCEKLKLTQLCLYMCTNTRDIKIYIQEDKAYVEND